MKFEEEHLLGRGSSLKFLAFLLYGLLPDLAHQAQRPCVMRL